MPVSIPTPVIEKPSRVQHEARDRRSVHETRLGLRDVPAMPIPPTGSEKDSNGLAKAGQADSSVLLTDSLFNPKSRREDDRDFWPHFSVDVGRR